MNEILSEVDAGFRCVMKKPRPRHTLRAEMVILVPFCGIYSFQVGSVMDATGCYRAVGAKQRACRVVLWENFSTAP